MKERPILFSGPMVRALLSGTKTQTRRVVKPTSKNSWLVSGGWADSFVTDPENRITDDCPYGQPGDSLWVRETWTTVEHKPGYDGPHDLDSSLGEATVKYQADGSTKWFDELDMDGDDQASRGWGSWKPSIHMPRWASRITLEITAVRVERLQDISDEDARAEGCSDCPYMLEGDEPQYMKDFGMGFAKQRYRTLWNKINGHGSWDVNPWVWVVEFKRVEK